MATILRRAHTWLLYAGGAYVVFLALLSYEPIQRQLLYLHKVRWPINANFSSPEDFGFAPGKVRNFCLKTHDGATIGAWHVLPSDIYDAQVKQLGYPRDDFPKTVFDEALKSTEHPTVLYLHGNAASRAQSHRVKKMQLLSDQNKNVLVIDYRGFADSSSTPPPSETGLLTDARRAYDYLTLEKGTKASQITIFGHSLGTGVASSLTATLASEGVEPKSLILLAPYSSIASLLKTYRLAKSIPILEFLSSVPWFVDFLLGKVLQTKFDTLSLIQDIRCPILLLHSLTDLDIPSSHSTLLFSHLLSPLLPPLPPSTQHQTLSALAQLERERKDIVDKFVKEERMGRWGTVRSFERSYGKGKWGKVVMGIAERGGHNLAGEGAMRLVKDFSD